MTKIKSSVFIHGRHKNYRLWRAVERGGGHFGNICVYAGACKICSPRNVDLRGYSDTFSRCMVARCYCSASLHRASTMSRSELRRYQEQHCEAWHKFDFQQDSSRHTSSKPLARCGGCKNCGKIRIFTHILSGLSSWRACIGNEGY